MATQKVLSISDYPYSLVCIRNSESVNPYLLYVMYRANDKYGYPTTHRKKLVAYGDMASVVWHIKDLYAYGFPYRSIDKILAWNKQYRKPEPYLF